MSVTVFSRNPVWRAYTGGAGIGILSGDAGMKDSHFPEDWIASCVEALNDQYRKPGHGLSRTSGGEVFAEVLKRDPDYFLGARHVGKYGPVPGFLMKILDSAERLPIQAHPTVPDAKKYYHSPFGKTECWVVVGSREVNGEKPYLLLGCGENMDAEVFLDEARRGEFSRGAGMLRKWEVSPGDVFIVPGGIPHAIGPGATIIEIMEPSDWVVQPEHFCGDQPLSDGDRFGPLSPEDALKIFKLAPETAEETSARCRPRPRLLERSGGMEFSAVVPIEAVKLFEVRKLRGSGRFNMVNREECCRAGVITGGSFRITAGGGSVALRAGESFFLPFAEREYLFEGDGELILTLPEYGG